MQTQLYVLGTGIRGHLQLTAETQQALTVCHRAFVLHADTRVLDAIRAHCSNVTDLADVYVGHTLRRTAYQAIAARVVDTASDDGPVAFVVHGHPFFLVSASEYILKMAESKGLRAVALPGVSSFDTLLCDLKIDLAYGVQLYDTTTLLDNGWIPNHRVPMLLFQLATTCEDRVVREDRLGTILQPIIDLLQPLYGDEHQVRLIYSAAGLLDVTRTKTYKLAELAMPHVSLSDRPTLYVPPAGK